MRVYVDSTVMPFIDKATLEELISKGITLVFTNTVVDVLLLRRDTSWTEKMLKHGHIVIEMWNTLDEMVQKPFYWSSFGTSGMCTPAFKSWLEAMLSLPYPSQMARLSYLVKEFGIPKGEWSMGEWTPPAPISSEDAAALGVDPKTATRTDILMAARKSGNLEAYSHYNVGYCTGIARQHMCKGILNANGTVTMVFDA